VALVGLGFGEMVHRPALLDCPLTEPVALWHNRPERLEHACARVGDRISCWGSNRYGQLGFPTTGTGLQPGPTSVMSLSGVVQVSAGGLFTCARVAGRVWCWGGTLVSTRR
jgi:alpha-tubulin suppressor-like RCC1 family protein